MPLLSKFITHHPTTRHVVASYSQDPQLTSILANLQTLLQSRRTFTNSQKTGINDFSEQLLGDALMHQLCQDFAKQINAEEPRLTQVSVNLIQSTGYMWRMEVNAQLSQRQQVGRPTLTKPQALRFILELAKSAYTQQRRDVSVVML